MASRGFDIEGMQERITEYKAYDIEEVFQKGLLKADDVLLMMKDSLDKCNCFVPELGTVPYYSNCSSIRNLKEDLIFLGEYPERLERELYNLIDEDFRKNTQEAYDALNLVKLNDLVYSNNSVDSLVKTPVSAWKEIKYEIKKVETDLPQMSDSMLVATFRISDDMELRRKCEDEIKNRLRARHYIDPDEKLSSEFPMLREMDVIYNYEKQHPISATKVDKFLNSDADSHITEKDIIRIKYMIYETADEDYRDYFIKNIGNCQITTTSYEGDASSFFSPTSGGVTLNYYSDFLLDPRGADTTLMHELGHNEDYYCRRNAISGYDSAAYRTAYFPFEQKYECIAGKTISELIEYDVFDNPNSAHSVYSVATKLVNENETSLYFGADIESVIKALKVGIEPDPITDTVNRKLYDDTVTTINNAMKISIDKSQGGIEPHYYEAVTDITNGVTDRIIYGNDSRYYVHSKEDYWKSDSRLITEELFAEFFSYNMTGNIEKVNITREYFPLATLAIDEMVGK